MISADEDENGEAEQEEESGRLPERLVLVVEDEPDEDRERQAEHDRRQLAPDVEAPPEEAEPGERQDEDDHGRVDEQEPAHHLLDEEDGHQGGEDEQQQRGEAADQHLDLGRIIGPGGAVEIVDHQAAPPVDQRAQGRHETGQLRGHQQADEPGRQMRRPDQVPQAWAGSLSIVIPAGIRPTCLADRSSRTGRTR